MNYSDFPILSPSNYNILAENYELNKLPSNEYFHIIYNKLLKCSYSLLTLKNNYNKNIINSIKNNATTIELLLDNFKSIFKVHNLTNKSFNEFNLFSHLKDLIKICSLFNSWLENENKPHINKFIINSNKSLLYSIENIVSAMEKSEIFIFKNM